MCFFPGGANVLIPPTEKGRKIADYLKIAIGIHLVLAILLFFGGRYIDGIFDLLGVVIGFLGIRNPEGYSFQQVLCYCVFCGMDVFWSILRLILYFSGAATTTTGSIAQWQYTIFIITLIAGPFVYTACTVISYYLYKDMKNIIDEMSTGVDGDGGMPPPSGAYGYAPQQNYAPPPDASSTNWSHPPNNPAPGGFKAFSGSGHRLGGE